MKNFFYIALALVLFACNTQVETVMIDAKALPVSSIYDVDTVYGFLKAYGKQNQEFAESFHKRAEDEKEKNLEKALHYLKRSLTLRPDKEVYLELAEVLDKNKQYAELAQLWRLFVSKVYSTDEFLFDTPDLDTWSSHFTSLVLANGRLFPDDIYAVEEFGLDRAALRKKVLADKRLALDTSSLDYKTIWVQFEDGEELRELTKLPSIFSAFIASAEDSSKSYSIDESTISNFKYSSENVEYFTVDLSMVFVYYLPEVADKKHAWLNYNIKHVFYPQMGLTAFVCAIDTSELGCPADMRHIYYRLLVFDSNRSLTDHKVIAQQSAETLQLASISNQLINISNLQRKWKKPYRKNDFDNELKSIVEQSTERYLITSQGKIIPASSEPAASL